MSDKNENMVLIIGDSIARHYYPYAEEHLKNKNVEAVTSTKWVSCQWKQLRFLDKNCKPKRGGCDIPAAYCHFNFGLHSIKLPNKGHDPEHQRAKPEEFEIYEKELIEQIETLWGFGVKPLFTNTTPNPKNAGTRNDADVVILNDIAKKVMNEKGVPYNDIYGFVKSQEDYPRLYMHPRAENNCHFDQLGRKLLGENIAQFILDNMENG